MNMKLIEGNAVVGQSGGPTAVINESLVGVIQGMRRGLRVAGGVKKIYGMRHGVNGLVKKDIVDLTDTPEDLLERVAHSPAAAPVSAVKTDHQARATRMTRRGPKRSASAPPGIWNSAYPRKNALTRKPVCRASIPRSRWIEGMVMLMAIRSSHATR